MARKERDANTVSIKYDFTPEGVVATKWKGEEFKSGEVLDTDTFLLRELPLEFVQRLTAYGLGKWLQDRTSESKGADAKLADMRGYFEKACAGEWRKAATASVRGIDPLLAAALAEVYDAPLAAVLKRLSGMTPDERKAINTGDVAVRYAELRAEAETEVGF
jgi:hypothetical protein